jgi:hypothetical protein
MQAEGRRLADSAWRHQKYAGRPNPPYFNEMDSIPAKACLRQGADNDNYFC